jgi:hypothetical protein
MQGIFGPILGSKASDVSIVTSLDPFGREVEAGSNGDLEVWETHVFNIPFRGLVIGFLVISHSVSESFDLLTKSVFHLTVDRFAGSDGFEESITDAVQSDSVNVVPDGVEGHDNCSRGEWLAT